MAELELSLSMSILLGDVPAPERPAAAAALGYRAVESWWPWPDGEPSDDDIDGFAAGIRDAGTRLHLVNATEGGQRWGGQGLACEPAAEAEFAGNAEQLARVVDRTGVRFVNLLAGLAGADLDASRDTLLRRVVVLADLLAGAGATVLVEQLNPADRPRYLLTDPAETLAVVREARAASRSGNVAMLADAYHLGHSGVDVAQFYTTAIANIGHAQLADAPGRGRPGTGALPLSAAVTALYAAGYDGCVGLEYAPAAAEAIPDHETMRRELRATEPEGIRAHA